jgi:hypothetical protein
MQCRAPTRYASRSGLVWAIEFSKDGKRVRCVGPMAAIDADPILLDHLVYSTSDLDWLRDNWTEFKRYDRCGICGEALAPGSAAVAIDKNHSGHLSCSLNPPSPGETDSVGAMLRHEELWHRSSRLRTTSAALRKGSAALLRRGGRLPWSSVN